MQKKETIYKIVGEVIVTSPLVVASFFIDLLPHCLLSIILLFIYKQFYKHAYHSSRNIVCTLITYSSLIIILAVTKLFNSQYFITILMCGLVAFVNAYVGLWNLNSKILKTIKPHYDELVNAEKNNAIDIYKMSENELRIYAISKHLSEVIVDTLILKVIHNYKWIDIQNERNYSKTAINYHRKQIMLKLNLDKI